jgi:hypothetical protein
VLTAGGQTLMLLRLLTTALYLCNGAMAGVPVPPKWSLKDPAIIRSPVAELGTRAGVALPGLADVASGRVALARRSTGPRCSRPVPQAESARGRGWSQSSQTYVVIEDAATWGRWWMARWNSRYRITRSSVEAFTAQWGSESVEHERGTCDMLADLTSDVEEAGRRGGRRLQGDVHLQQALGGDLGVGMKRQQRPGGEPDEGRDLDAAQGRQ